MGGGRGGRKDGGREGRARTEPALFRREHRAQAPAEREAEEAERPENRGWGGRGGEQASWTETGMKERQRDREWERQRQERDGQKRKEK